MIALRFRWVEPSVLTEALLEIGHARFFPGYAPQHPFDVDCLLDSKRFNRTHPPNPGLLRSGFIPAGFLPMGLACQSVLPSIYVAMFLRMACATWGGAPNFNNANSGGSGIRQLPLEVRGIRLLLFFTPLAFREFTK